MEYWARSEETRRGFFREWMEFVILRNLSSDFETEQDLLRWAVCMTPQPEAGLPDDKRRESAEREREREREVRHARRVASGGDCCWDDGCVLALHE